MADSTFHKLINWIAAQRVDVPDMLAILDQVIDGFRVLGNRVLDTPNLGGHVLSGFQIDSAAGLASLVVGNGTYFDADGLVVRYEGKTVDASAFGAGDEFTVWARWEWVDSDQLSRVFISSGDEVLLPHNTKRSANVYLEVTDASGSPPPGAYDWSYLIRLKALNPFVPGNLQVRYNVAWERWQYTTWRSEDFAVAIGPTLYNGLERVREALVSWTTGLGNDNPLWDLPDTVRSVTSLDTALATAEANVANLLKLNVRASGQYNEATSDCTPSMNVGSISFPGGTAVSFHLTDSVLVGDQSGRGPAKVAVAQIQTGAIPTRCTYIVSEISHEHDITQVTIHSFDTTGAEVMSSYVWWLQI